MKTHHINRRNIDETQDNYEKYCIFRNQKFMKTILWKKHYAKHIAIIEQILMNSKILLKLNNYEKQIISKLQKIMKSIIL